VSWLRRLRLGGAAGMVAVASLGAAAADGLASLRWQYRPLLLFTPDETDPRLSRQTTELAGDLDGLTDRRLAVLIIDRARVFTTFGAPAPAAETDTLRRRFRVPDDAFQVILVGLDGGEKLRESAPVTRERLFQVIDGMAMRQRELRERDTPR